MKIMTLLVAASALVASSVSANIGDVDATIDEIKTSAVFVAQPLSVTNRVLAAQDTCVLPITHLVAVPQNFEAAGEVVVACATE